MTFESALHLLKQGVHMKRRHWHQCRWVYHHMPMDEACSEPHLVMALPPPKGGMIPWLPNQQDLLADDWIST